MKTVLTLGIIIMITLGTTVPAAVLSSVILLQTAYGATGGREPAPMDGVAIAASGDNVYLMWPSNKTGNWEIQFRASDDGGNTFADKINLSNSSNSDSTINNGIATSDEGNIYISWNDNKTGNVETYLRVSTDNGQSFTPAVMINGTGTNPQQFESESTSASGLDILDTTFERTEVAASW